MRASEISMKSVQLFGFFT